ncbi:MAG: glutamate-5-semialdehyde dehydrogenase [Candidatus Methylacidiphilales bacterium]|nr:glutamate-5-semialdehyde dehydrogenase [Candidatus Methylacidiphilales bacterium]
MADLKQTLETLGRDARLAARRLAYASTDEKNRLLGFLATTLDSRRGELAAGNAMDLAAGKEAGLSAAMLDRLEFTPKRIDAMIQGVRDVIALPDPVGDVLKAWTLPSGLAMQKVRVPIGVIGIIYESRPNVTVDAAILCLKTGNAVILRGGKEAFHSNRVLGDCIRAAAEQAGLPAGVCAIVPTTDREAIALLCAMDQHIDLMIPRGGYGLIETVVTHARMPVLKHFHGVCHVYVHEKADPAMAESVVVNAKTQRPGTCNAAETLLVDRSVAATVLPKVAVGLKAKGVKLLGDAEVSGILGEKLSEPENWKTEYLDLVMAVRVVSGFDEAVDHIETYGSHHSDAIVTGDAGAAEQFIARVDSAAVFWNASTRLNDGGEFGFGAEIGISTDKIHARGPMALEELTSYKYVARGNGQIRA